MKRLARIACAVICAVLTIQLVYVRFAMRPEWTDAETLINLWPSHLCFVASVVAAIALKE